jgi:hypothetical protein
MRNQILPLGTPYRTLNDVSGWSLVDPGTSQAPPLSLWPVSCRRHLQVQPIYDFINPLKPKLVQIIFKDSVRTVKKTHLFTITKINCLMLFTEIIAVYSENHTKHKNTK